MLIKTFVFFLNNSRMLVLHLWFLSTKFHHGRYTKLLPNWLSREVRAKRTRLLDATPKSNPQSPSQSVLWSSIWSSSGHAFAGFHVISRNFISYRWEDTRIRSFLCSSKQCIHHFKFFLPSTRVKFLFSRLMHDILNCCLLELLYF